MPLIVLNLYNLCESFIKAKGKINLSFESLHIYIMNIFIFNKYKIIWVITEICYYYCINYKEFAKDVS